MHHADSSVHLWHKRNPIKHNHLYIPWVSQYHFGTEYVTGQEEVELVELAVFGGDFV